MALTSELGKQLYQKCQLEARLQALEQQKQSLERQLPQAKFAKREADVARLEYESGGLRAFFDRLSGKWEDKRDSLARDASAANAALQNLQRQLEAADRDLSEAKEAWEAVSGLGDTVERARVLDEPEQTWLLHTVAAVSADKLLPLLQTAAKALEEAQEWARPNNRIDAAPGYTKGKLLAEAGRCAKDCGECLRRIERCGILLEVHPYFENPAGYISAVASQFAELDRINKALDAIRRTERQTKELLQQLAQVEMP